MASPVSDKHDRGKHGKRKLNQQSSPNSTASTSSSKSKKSRNDGPTSKAKKSRPGKIKSKDTFASRNFGWRHDYKKRAALVKIQCPLEENATQSNINPFNFELNAVAFFTYDPLRAQQERTVKRNITKPIVYGFVEQYGDTRCALAEEFKKALENYGIKLNYRVSIESENWKKMMELVEESAYYKWCAGDNWMVGNETALPETHPLFYLHLTLHEALLHGMGNDVTKEFCEHLFNYIFQVLNVDEQNMKHRHPCPATNLITGSVQLQVHNKWHLQANEQDDVSIGSNESLCSLWPAPPIINRKNYIDRDRVVCPDYFVFLKHFPGFFIANLEFKKAKDHNDGIFQCIQQMLTQMHFQDHSFGIVLSSKKWVVIFMKKENQQGKKVMRLKSYERYFYTELAKNAKKPKGVKEPGVPDVTCLRSSDSDGASYVGTLKYTKSGIKCQRWDSQKPHGHRFSYLGDQENYCRNPDGADGPWCFTVDDDKRWDYCDVPTCPPACDTMGGSACRDQKIIQELAEISKKIGNLRQVEQCPDGWDYLGVAKKCYKYFDRLLQWSEARTLCIAKGGKLAEPQTLQSMRELAAYAAPEAIQQNIWVGIRELNTKARINNWVARRNNWVFDSNGKAVTYNDWADGQPNSPTENCLHLWRPVRTNPYKMADALCTLSMPFICEKETNY